MFVAFPLFRVMTYPKLSHYQEYFTRSRWIRATFNSLTMAVLSTISITFCAFIYAYGMVRTNVPFKRLLETVAILPILSPPFVVAISYIMLFGGRGLVTHKLLGMNVNIYGWQGLWLVQTVTFFPFAYLVIRNVLESISPNLEYAAANLGSTKWQTFWKVIFPLARPGVAGAALLAAISCLADFGNPVLIAGNYAVLPTEAYMQITGWYNLPAAAVLATMLIIPTLILFIVQRYWVSKRVYTTIVGKSSSLRRPEPSKAERYLVNAFCLLFGGLILLIYGTLLWGAFSKVWGADWSLTTKNFAYAFSQGKEIGNSIKFSIGASLLCAFLSIITAYIVQRYSVGAMNSFLDFLAKLPGAIPGVFLGIGYILAFNTPPLALTGTGTIIILALLFWNLPMGYRTGTAAIQQLDRCIEKASMNLGAGNFYTFTRIILPLMKTAFFATFTMAFLRSITNLSITIFLYSSKTVVGTISILNLVNNAKWSWAAAMTSVLIGIALVTLLISQKLLGKENLFTD